MKPSFERQVVTLVNAHRRSIGLRALKVAAPLRRAARWKSRHMARYRYFEHADPSGRSPFARMRDCGYRARRTMGENIAAGQRTPRAVVRAWLDSPGHRQNIENPAFTQIGVGAAFKRGSDYGWYWTQDFGG